MKRHSAVREPSRGLSFAEFVSGFVRVLDERTRRIVPLVPHREQRRFIAAVDTIDPVTRLRQFADFVLSWGRKLGKSTMDAAFGLWALTCDPFAGDREVGVLSSTLQQSQDAPFLAMRRIISRDPWLRRHLRVLSTEIVFKDASGEHVLRVLPRDSRGIHGQNLSALIADEVWTHESWDVLEGVSPSPARQSPMTAWSSFAGLRHQRRPGYPWYDVLSRAQRGDDPRTFVSHVEGREALLGLGVGWITRAWLDRMERQFASVPSRGARIALNIWPIAADTDALLGAAEIRDAVDPTLVEPERGDAGVEHTIGLDVGLRDNPAALIMSHVDAGTSSFSSCLVVDAIRVWRGTAAAPVSLTAVETEICALAARFKISRIVMDAWQAEYLRERLARRLGCRVETVQITPAWHDVAVTRLKALFTARLVRVPADARLLDELNSASVAETARHDRLKLEPGRSRDGSHGDLLIALALSIGGHGDRIGRAVLPEQSECYRAASGLPVPGGCYLWGGDYVPSGCPSCASCPSHRHVMALWRSQGVHLGLRDFAESLGAENSLVRRKKWDQLKADYIARFAL